MTFALNLIFAWIELCKCVSREKNHWALTWYFCQQKSSIFCFVDHLLFYLPWKPCICRKMSTRQQISTNLQIHAQFHCWIRTWWSRCDNFGEIIFVFQTHSRIIFSPFFLVWKRANGNSLGKCKWHKSTCHKVNDRLLYSNINYCFSWRWR